VLDLDIIKGMFTLETYVGPIWRRCLCPEDSYERIENREDEDDIQSEEPVSSLVFLVNVYNAR